MSEDGFTYRDAGVDLEAASAVKDRIRALVEGTRTGDVRGEYGSFGGRFRLPEGAEIVASADGVGTKLKVAFRAGRHDTVGRDLVNHCVDDILTEGAVPLFFLDYFATGELEEGVTLEVVEGIARGCRENGCALLGGETAEMPDFYGAGEYDLAGFVVGRVAFPEVGRRELQAGDRLVGLASTGIHTNGYTFARRVLFDRMGLEARDPWPGEGHEGASVADVLLTVHRSYLGPLRDACEAGTVRALAHVTGGGIPGNLGRVLPAGLDAVVDLAGVPRPPEFDLLQEESGASTREMYRVFNMGVGMIAFVRPGDEEAVLEGARAAGCPAYPCGELAEGGGEVRLAGLP